MAHNELSVLAEFDDIYRRIRCIDHNAAEIELLKILEMQETYRLKCRTLKQEMERIRCELDVKLQSKSDLEMKLFHARRLLEEECRARQKAKTERNVLERKIMAVSDLLQNAEGLHKETRDKLALLYVLPCKEEKMMSTLDQEYCKYSNDVNSDSTASILSELLVETSEEAIDISSGVGDTKRNKKITFRINSGMYCKNKLGYNNFGRRLCRHSCRFSAVKKRQTLPQQPLNLVDKGETVAVDACNNPKDTKHQDEDRSHAN